MCRIGPAPDDATVFWYCLPAHHTPPPVRWTFNPDLRTVLHTQRRLRPVAVRFQVDEVSIPAP